MPTDKVDLTWPLGGISRRFGFQQNAEHIYTCPDSLNVRNADVFAHRLRGGSRAGLAQILPPRASDDPPADVIPDTIEIAATKDVYIGRHDNTYTPDDQNTDFGFPKGNNVKCGCPTTGDVYRALFHFDLTNVPTAATITAATFMDIGFAAPGGAADVGDLMWARRLTQTGWSETYKTGSTTYGTTSWTRYNLNSSLSWAAEGGDYTVTDQVQWALGPSPSGSFSITGLAAMATTAMVSVSKQLHLILMRQDEGTPSARVVGYEFMNSQEWGDSFPTSGPRLSVTYE
jgi:hypothetical protein